MCVVSKPSSSPAEILSTLVDGHTVVEPTERWASTWRPELTTTDPNVYGLYVRSIPMIKWLDRSVRDMVENYPGEVGSGSMPQGLDAFTVPGTNEAGLGEWVLLYVGFSDSATARIIQYFGRTEHFTREMGGQSFHLGLSLLFGGTCDPRNSTTPRGKTIENVLRGSMSVILEERMRDMRFSYVQVTTPVCPGADRVHLTCGCNRSSENAHLKNRVSNSPPSSGWPTGARPLMNSEW
jgi:hypothetical protein